MLRTQRPYSRKVLISSTLQFQAFLLLGWLAGLSQADYVANAPHSQSVQTDHSQEITPAKGADGLTGGTAAASPGRDDSVQVLPASDPKLFPEKTQDRVADRAVDAFETQAVSPAVASDQTLSGKSSPQPREGSDRSLSPGRILLSLIAVLILVVAGAVLLRRYGRISGRIGTANGTEILLKSSINARQSLCLMKVGSRVLVLGLSPNHMAALDVIDDPDEVAMITGHLESTSPRSISDSFRKLFQKESEHFEDESKEKLKKINSAPSYRYRDSEQVDQARRELTGLLDKVKGLGRLRRL